MHDYANQFNMKWKENQLGGRKVVASNNAFPWAHKVGRRLAALPNMLRRQWLYKTTVDTTSLFVRRACTRVRETWRRDRVTDAAESAALERCDDELVTSSRLECRLVVSRSTLVTLNHSHASHRSTNSRSFCLLMWPRLHMQSVDSRATLITTSHGARLASSTRYELLILAQLLHFHQRRHLPSYDQ